MRLEKTADNRKKNSPLASKAKFETGAQLEIKDPWNSIGVTERLVGWVERYVCRSAARRENESSATPRLYSVCSTALLPPFSLHAHVPSTSSRTRVDVLHRYAPNSHAPSYPTPYLVLARRLTKTI